MPTEEPPLVLLLLCRVVRLLVLADSRHRHPLVRSPRMRHIHAVQPILAARAADAADARQMDLGVERVLEGIVDCHGALLPRGGGARRIFVLVAALVLRRGEELVRLLDDPHAGLPDAPALDWLQYDPFMNALDFVCSRTLRIDVPPSAEDEGMLRAKASQEGEEDQAWGESGERVPGQFRNYSELERGGGQVVRVMVPLLDLANHSPRGGKFDTDELGNICLLVTTPVAAGEEVFLDYG